MDRIQDFFKKNGFLVISILLFLLLMQTCTLNSNIKSLKKEVKVLKGNVDTLSTIFDYSIKLEGLNSEDRMIQATDRKILDVNRQATIQKERGILEDKIKSIKSIPD